MGRLNELVIIEIGEDAYKQNAVYRPWDELLFCNPDTPSATPATSQENLKPRLRSRLQAASVTTPP